MKLKNLTARAFGLSIVSAHSHHKVDLNLETSDKVATKSFITGSGPHTYKTVPNWGRGENGFNRSTHGGIAVAKDGRVFISTLHRDGIVVYSKEGNFLKAFGVKSRATHSLFHKVEGTQEVLYTAFNTVGKIVKYDLEGNELLTINSKPEVYNLKGVTAVTSTRNGDIYAVTGYGDQKLIKFDSKGNFIAQVGSKGRRDNQFWTCHGITVDTRYRDERLLICDRRNNRLLHYSTDLKLMGIHATGLRRPCAAHIRGNEAVVAELQGRVTILNKEGSPIAFLGENLTNKAVARYPVPLSEMYNGVFVSPHGVSFTNEGDIIVQDWNQTGRITKLEHIKF